MKKSFISYGRVVSTLLLMLAMALGANPVMAKVDCADKPDHPQCTDPEPEDPGAVCADSGSFFPAFAYVFTGEVLLSNSAGDCSISLYTEEINISGNPTRISYRLHTGLDEDSGNGKIVFSARTYDRSVAAFTRSRIMLLEFNVENGAITTPLPLTPRLLLYEPEDFGNVYGADLHPDENKVIVQAYEEGEVRGYIWEFDIPDPGSGPVSIENDVRELANLDITVDPVDNATFYNVRYGISGNRVYFSYGYPQRMLSYIEKTSDDPDAWSPRVLIAERWNGDLGPGSIMEWDFGDGPREVMAFTNTIDGVDQIEILDVDLCVMNGGDCVIIEGIEGWDDASFTTFTEGQLPALLYLYDVDARNVGFSIRECDLTAALQSVDACYRTVINGVKDPKRSLYGVDAAD